MKKIRYIMLGAALLMAGACSDQLDINPTGNRITEEDIQRLVKEDPDLVLEPMLNTMVAAINTYTFANSVDTRNWPVMNILLSLKGNDMVLANRNGTWLVNDYELRAYREESTARVAVYWGTLYKYVYYANEILGLIPPDVDLNTADGSNEKIMRYKAAALTMRAFSYTYLMWLYQDDYLHGGAEKPGVLLHLDNNDPFKDRAPASAVWAQVIADATEAVRLFEAAGSYKTEDRTDIDGSVASVVLARAALTMGDWSTAIAAADKVIAAYPMLMNEAQYTTSGMTVLDNEAIFGYEVDVNSSRGTSSFPGWMNPWGEGGYGGSQGSWVAIDQRLYDQIPETDYRKANFVSEDYIEFTYPSSGATIHYPKYASTKFAAGIISGQTTAYYQNEIYMRASEMLLVKAEAEARAGNDEAAQRTLFQLVSQRDPAYTQSTNTGEALFAEIRLHRRIELWGEGGFEFYDNKRWNLPVDRTGSANHVYKEVTLTPQRDYTLQLPLESELLLNPNITQQNP
ncbi:RagB/SusD family nutrient uptake outer membrane protein [Parapedobacter sp. ISTM3]|uniref:RagB/SusD family nutrient uptake outer membrane protein n=1 Tax=Parapedobacter sp. ISTM3 TaxID=2800130 RepID=UPI001902D8D0|nr:RagB/SusD family nutrient uptake outer membrane protein [Parapedobacter sp. ISTM3]MBK1442409.1 RagB/SusD family nutrient uptake outer membrane protein [Parapedobacter sp. ISTM3]